MIRASFFIFRVERHQARSKGGGDPENIWKICQVLFYGKSSKLKIKLIDGLFDRPCTDTE